MISLVRTSVRPCNIWTNVNRGHPTCYFIMLMISTWRRWERC
jgi:hypothetical protein